LENNMETMLLVPVDDSVVFPTMTVTLAVDVGTEERVVLVPRNGDEFASVGTVATVAERIRLPGGARAVALEG
jgi:ATP-dependent Lon protease